MDQRAKAGHQTEGVSGRFRGLYSPSVPPKAAGRRDKSGLEKTRVGERTSALSPALERLKNPPRFASNAVLGLLFTLATTMIVLGIFFALSNDPKRTVQALPILQINILLIAVIVLTVGRQMWRILFPGKNLQSAPLLHRRFVMIFSLAALTPAVLVGAFSTSLISRNINDVFGGANRIYMEEAREFLESYLADERRSLIRDVGTLKRRLNSSPELLNNRITNSARLGVERLSLGFDEIFLMTGDGMVLMRAQSGQAPEMRIPVRSAFGAVKSGEMAFSQRDDINYLASLTELEAYKGVYLYGGRYLRSDSKVLSSISGIDNSEKALEGYIADQKRLEQVFGLTFMETVLIVLTAAIWLGIMLANRIIDPLGRLVEAAEQVRDGNLSVSVDVQRDWGEMSDLGAAFNRMTRQLSSQREALIREHDISEQRRQFSEAVLSGVRAGVVGLSQEGRITLVNASATSLLGMHEQHLLGQPIETILPEFSDAFKSAREDVLSTSEGQVNFETKNGMRNFDLRVSAYLGARKDTGWVMTFDDRTRLVAAQRHSAWREVARRIAHEIKNPLTPIQLSVERLQRKYAGVHQLKDPEIFDSCTQTIIRQVGSLERMVDEFSTFARMPAPEFERVDLRDLLDDVVFEQGVAFPDVKFNFGRPGVAVHVLCDTRLIAQALTNILKNAAEAIGRRMESSDAVDEGRVDLSIIPTETHYQIHTTDNGAGWPLPDKERLLEPYVTTRESGTGLGLAIVQRVAEDHGGYLSLVDRIDGLRGAEIIFSLPMAEENAFPRPSKLTDITGDMHEI
jgi:two-component system nitrogen regulation sensor histidine kinase NtrY